MDTKPYMTRLKVNIGDIIEKTANEKKWSVSSTISDILTEVVINNCVPNYLSNKS